MFQHYNKFTRATLATGIVMTIFFSSIAVVSASQSAPNVSPINARAQAPICAPLPGTPTLTVTPVTLTPLPTNTALPTCTPTTGTTPTPTPIPPTATKTAVPPTQTPIVITATPVPTNTPAPTQTPIVITATPLTPTATRSLTVSPTSAKTATPVVLVTLAPNQTVTETETPTETATATTTVTITPTPTPAPASSIFGGTLGVALTCLAILLFAAAVGLGAFALARYVMNRRQ
jgi:type VI secretion system secreted protein VgrG